MNVLRSFLFRPSRRFRILREDITRSLKGKPESISVAVVDLLRGPRRSHVGTFWVPASLLANIAREAGVHLYGEPGTIVTTDGRLLAVTSGEGGRKTIAFPRPADVEDALDGTAPARQTTEYELRLKPGETRLERIGG
jgi:hypothetical protein